MMQDAGSLQVVIGPSRAGVLSAGLPPGLRAAYEACRIPGAGPVVVCGRDADPQRWRRQLAAMTQARWDGTAPADRSLRQGKPLLVLSGEGFPAPGTLAPALGRLRAAGGPARWLCAGQTAAVYLPRFRDAASGTTEQAALAALGSDAAAVEAPGWHPAYDRATALAAEAALCAGLSKDTDGYFARLDRKVSIALSRLLLRTPVTPNAITTASLILGLIGAAGLASGRCGVQLAGALLLWVCCVLDGSDGEVARLKLLMSPSGAAYDLAADHVSHLATFVAIPIGVHRLHPQAAFFWPAVLLVSGFLTSMVAVWRLVLRLPQERRGRAAVLIERLASRDYVYLIVALAAIRRLDWFLWAAGVGSHAFYLALLWLTLSRPSPSAAARLAPLRPSRPS